MIDPRDMTVLNWTDRMAQLLPFPVYKLLDPDGWRHWAHYVMSYPSISTFNPPSPEEYSDWREWAIRFNQVVVL